MPADKRLFVPDCGQSRLMREHGAFVSLLPLYNPLVSQFLFTKRNMFYKLFFICRTAYGIEQEQCG